MSTPMDDKAREAFEAHASQGGKFPAVVHRGEDGEYTNPFTHSTHRAWNAALQWAASQQAAEGPAASIPEFGSKMFTGNNRAFLETFTVHVDPDLPPNEVQFRYIDRVVCRLLLDAAPPATQGGE